MLFTGRDEMQRPSVTQQAWANHETMALGAIRVTGGQRGLEDDVTDLVRLCAGAVPGPRPHDQRHQWCFLRRVLLHLLPEVGGLHRGLLLPQELGMVRASGGRGAARSRGCLLTALCVDVVLRVDAGPLSMTSAAHTGAHPPPQGKVSGMKTAR